MFGNIGNIGKLMKMAGEMKHRMPELQEKLEKTEFAAEAGGGVVEAVVNGKLRILRTRIDPKLLADGDAAMLEDLVTAAVSAAQARAAEGAKQAMQELTGGMELPGMEGMLGM